MAKTKQGSYDKSLFIQMKKLAKRANQRILRLERLTDMTESFTTKQLYDYLSIEELQAITVLGRVRVRKDYSRLQMKTIIRALNKFLVNPLSTKRGITKYAKEISSEVQDDLTYKQLNTYYQASGRFKWIIDYFPSSFWDLARESVRDNWSQEKFTDIVGHMIEKEVDEDLKKDLQNLYDYTRDVRI